MKPRETETSYRCFTLCLMIWPLCMLHVIVISLRLVLVRLTFIRLFFLLFSCLLKALQKLLELSLKSRSTLLLNSLNHGIVNYNGKVLLFRDFLEVFMALLLTPLNIYCPVTHMCQSSLLSHFRRKSKGMSLPCHLTLPVLLCPEPKKIKPRQRQRDRDLLCSDTCFSSGDGS